VGEKLLSRFYPVATYKNKMKLRERARARAERSSVEHFAREEEKKISKLCILWGGEPK
jgi:hypothetical protein